VQVIEVFLGTTSFGDFLTRMEWLRRVSESDASMLASVKVAKGRVRDARAKLERREEEQIVLRDRAKTKQREIERALADQETYVAGIDAEVGKLVHEEQERLDRIAEERARIAREEAARAAAAAARAAVNTGSVTPVDPATLGQGHPEVVDVALSFIGVPYHWAGSGPGMCPDGTHDICFDCSGLTWYSFKRIGIDIPRSSSLQWNSGLGQRIPASQTDLLRAGDLVFFGYGGDPNHVHHVGIYVGNGDFVHAPQTGKPVLVMPLSMRSDYVGAVRL
jgi:cell wall-associated NlpC family hydrolase